MNEKKESLGKVLPNAVEAENIVIGTLMAFNGSFYEIVSLLSPGMFYNKSNENVYSAIMKLDMNNVAVDIVSVSEQLKNDGKLEESGGYMYLSKLLDKSSAGVGRLVYYARIIAQKHVQRELIYYGYKIANMAGDESFDVEATLSHAAIMLDRAGSVLLKKSTMEHVAVAIDAAAVEASEREQAAKNGTFMGITSGITKLDNMTYGFKPGDMVVIAGRPGSGKTSFLIHMAKHIATTGKWVCVFSLEMSAVSLADKLILSETGIDVGRYKSGYLKREDWAEIEVARRGLSKLPINVDDYPIASLREIKSRCLSLKRKGMCDIILIDYFQLVDMSTGERGRNRENEVSQASRQVKIIAKELGCPVVILSQLNRSCEERADKRPQLSDLRESGAIEQDADIVLFVYRPEYYGLKNENGSEIRGEGKLIVAKHRNGATGDVKFGYNESLTKIYDVNS